MVRGTESSNIYSDNTRTSKILLVSLSPPPTALWRPKPPPRVDAGVAASVVNLDDLTSLNSADLSLINLAKMEDSILLSEPEITFCSPNHMQYLCHVLGKEKALAIRQKLLADSGSNESFCNLKYLIHGLTFYPTPRKVFVADNISIAVLGYGFLVIPDNNNKILHIPVKYAPQLPNIISTRKPREFHY